MRRNDREVTEPAEVRAIIEGADSCRLGLVDLTKAIPTPYVVALSFGYEPTSDCGAIGTFYFHGAMEGRKLEIIRHSPQATIQLDGEHEPVKAVQNCGWGMKYASVVAEGVARVVEEPGERQRGLECLMAHYLRLWGPAQGAPHSPTITPSFEPGALKQTCVFCVDVQRLSAKRKP